MPQIGPGSIASDSRRGSAQVDPLDWPLKSYVRDQPCSTGGADQGVSTSTMSRQTSEPRGFIALPPVDLGSRALSIDSSSFNMEPSTSCTSAEVTESRTLYSRRVRRDAVSGDSIGELYSMGN